MISTNYPLYSVVALSNGQIAIGGGGGSAKTGVPNAIEVHQLSAGSAGIESEQLAYIDTGKSAVMNCSARQGGKALVCGLDEKCAVVTLSSPSKASPTKGTRERRGGSSPSTESSQSDSLQLSITTKQQTDFHEKFALQKVVRFDPEQKLLATGGADGRIRLWKYPSLAETQVMDKMHTDDVDDLAFHPTQPLIVSVSCDKQCFVWKIGRDKNVGQLKFTKSPAGQPYKFRSCRFLPSLSTSSSSSSSASSASGATLVTTHSPVSLYRPPASYVCLWNADGDCDKWMEHKWASIGKDPVSCLSCLALPSGRFIGIGTMQGAVRIMNDSLQTIYSVSNAHEMYVTSLALTTLPTAKDSDLPLAVSVSDRTCRIVQVKRGYSRVVFLVLFLGCMAVLALLYLTKSHL